MSPDSFPIPPEVVVWMETLAGCSVKSVARVTGGLSRKAYGIEFMQPNQLGSMSAFLMLQGSVDNGGNQRDAQVLELLEDVQVLTPRVIAYNEQLHALLMEKLQGQADFSTIVDEQARQTVAEDLMLNLARLHAFTPGEQITLEQPTPGSVREAAVQILQPIVDFCRASPVLVDPFCEFCLAWLWNNLPSCEAELGLIHGDIGPGNFLFKDGKVTGIVDWELAHIGDPMEDLARIYIRSMSAPMGNLNSLMKVYQTYSGAVVDRKRVAYYIVLTLLKSVMLIRKAIHGTASTVEGPQKYMYEALLMRAAVDVLLSVNEVEPPPGIRLDSAARASRDGSIACHLLIHELREHLQPVVLDTWASERVEWILRLAQLLKQSEVLGPEFEAEDLQEIASMAQRSFDNMGDATEYLLKWIREWQDVDYRQLLQHLSRHVNRICYLRKDLLGDLFNNRIQF